jgi:hypothetical protein
VMTVVYKPVHADSASHKAGTRAHGPGRAKQEVSPGASMDGFTASRDVSSGSRLSRTLTHGI